MQTLNLSIYEITETKPRNCSLYIPNITPYSLFVSQIWYTQPYLITNFFPIVLTNDHHSSYIWIGTRVHGVYNLWRLPQSMKRCQRAWIYMALIIPKCDLFLIGCWEMQDYASIYRHSYISHASAKYRYIFVPPNVRLPSPICSIHVLWPIPLTNRLSIHG